MAFGACCHLGWCLVGLVLAGMACAESGGTGLQTTTYYFVRDSVCTVMVDFHDARAALDSMSETERPGAFVATMLDELAANGPTECESAHDVRMLAVFIPGVDEYGRPEFGKRTNILKFEGVIDELIDLREEVRGLDLERLQEWVDVVFYE